MAFPPQFPSCKKMDVLVRSVLGSEKLKNQIETFNFKLLFELYSK